MWADIVDKVKASILRVETLTVSGSGVALTERRIITNAHVIQY